MKKIMQVVYGRVFVSALFPEKKKGGKEEEERRNDRW